jgi:glutamate N-acetyltransferase/amino-acid N-acetyltransferase
MKSKEVKLRVDLKLGKAGAKVLTCDLTEEYVKINAEYTT